LILCADGKVRIEQCRGLPPQQLKSASAAAFGWLVQERGLSLGYGRSGATLGRPSAL
jgi:hypothetical protein